jgi:hypothetical protein
VIGYDLAMRCLAPIVLIVLTTGCSTLPPLLPVVRDIAGFATQVCTDGDDTFACLRKCEAAAHQGVCPCGDPNAATCEPCSP